MNPVNRFLLAVAGSNRAVLDHAPRDLAKQASLGGTLLTTAALAAVAGALALWMALDVAPWLAGVLGALWGLAILNLDRWLVTSTPRLSSKKATLALAAPRVVLAVVIGLVVSTPLTLQIFKAEIDSELIAMHTEELEAFETRLDADPRFSDIDEKKAEISELQLAIAAGAPADSVSANPEVAALTAQLAQVTIDYNAAEQEVACEKDGTCGSGVIGAGPAFEEKQARRDRLAGEVSRLQAALDAKTAEVRQSVATSTEQAAISNQARVDDLTDQVADAERKRTAEVAAHDATTESNDGLLARLEALHRLTADSWILQFAHILLFLFLTAIECLPDLLQDPAGAHQADALRVARADGGRPRRHPGEAAPRRRARRGDGRRPGLARGRQGPLGHPARRRGAHRPGRARRAGRPRRQGRAGVEEARDRADRDRARRVRRGPGDVLAPATVPGQDRRR